MFSMITTLRLDIRQTTEESAGMSSFNRAWCLVGAQECLLLLKLIWVTQEAAFHDKLLCMKFPKQKSHVWARDNLDLGLFSLILHIYCCLLRRATKKQQTRLHAHTCANTHTYTCTSIHIHTHTHVHVHITHPQKSTQGMCQCRRGMCLCLCLLAVSCYLATQTCWYLSDCGKSFRLTDMCDITLQILSHGWISHLFFSLLSSSMQVPESTGRK